MPSTIPPFNFFKNAFTIKRNSSQHLALRTAKMAHQPASLALGAALLRPTGRYALRWIAVPLGSIRTFIPFNWNTRIGSLTSVATATSNDGYQHHNHHESFHVFSRFWSGLPIGSCNFATNRSEGTPPSSTCYARVHTAHAAVTHTHHNGRSVNRLRQRWITGRTPLLHGNRLKL